MAITSLGASSERGVVHCALVTTDGGDIIDRQTRTIAPGGFPSFCSAERISSGFGLLEAYTDEPISAYGVASSSRCEVLGLRLRSVGPRRTATVVREVDAVLRALDASGAIARYESALLVDLGSGARLHLVDVGSGAVRWRSVPRRLGSGTPERWTDRTDEVTARITGALRVCGAPPQVVVLVGAGAAVPAVVAAVEQLVRRTFPATAVVVPEDPDAAAAVGAALLAADVAAGAAGAASGGPTRDSGRLATLGGHGTRLAAFALPLLVVAGVLLAAIVATLATGAIGTVGDSGATAPPATIGVTDQQIGGPYVVSTGVAVHTSGHTVPHRGAVDEPRDHALPTVASPAATTQRSGHEPAMTIFATPSPVAPPTGDGSLRATSWPTPSRTSGTDEAPSAHVRPYGVPRPTGDVPGVTQPGEGPTGTGSADTPEQVAPSGADGATAGTSGPAVNEPGTGLPPRPEPPAAGAGTPTGTDVPAGGGNTAVAQPPN